MILGREFRNTNEVAGPTLDGLLDALAQRQPGSAAISDAPNRTAIIGGAARRLTFGALAEEVDRLANQLIALGLATDSVIALHMPATTEAVIALLAINRAGMIAAPIPLGWGRRDIVAQLQRIAARGIITLSRTGAIDTADMMRHAAAMVFSVRVVCAYGEPVLDGVMPLDAMLDGAERPLPVVIERSGKADDHVSVVTADISQGGHIAVARDHRDWIVAGQVFAEALELSEGSRLACTLACDTLAGIGAQIIPWLLSGCEMELHPPFAARIFQESLQKGDTSHCILPVRAACVLLEMDPIPVKRVVLIARTTEDVALALRIMQMSDRFRCIFVAGEAGACAVSPVDGHLMPNPQLQTRITPGQTLAFGGAMVPRHAFPPGTDRATSGIWTTDDNGFVDTQFVAKAVDKTIVLQGNPAGILAVGGRRFSESEITAVYADAGGEIRPVIKADAVLGQRVTGVIGHGRGISGLSGRLERSGLTTLAIPGATRYGGPIPFEDTAPPAAAEPTDEQRAHIIKQLLTG